eukprot:c4506_g1_i1.p1 GENE.c4506_g1_i1~~c4506_g1_i1.p1  ORF type:complete len:294 (-),score=74.93 c4506_g1_i1:32-913(-)
MWACRSLTQIARCRPQLCNLSLTTNKTPFHTSATLLAGRKYQKTIRDKMKKDGNKAGMFAKFSAAIKSVVSQGGPDPASNSILSNIITRARAAGMSRIVLEQSIQKAAASSNAKEGSKWESVTYEARFGEGVLLIVDTLTDNRQRTGPKLRAAFRKFDGSIGVSASWAFDQRGIVACRCKQSNLEAIENAAIELGAEDVDIPEPEEEDGDLRSIDILCEPTELKIFRDEIEKRFCQSSNKIVTELSTDIIYLPKVTTTVNAEAYQALADLIEELEELDDVQRVFHNAVLEGDA